MILTCPECATGYFVDDAKIGPGGRTVRCKACGAQWRAHHETPLDLTSSPEEGALAAPEPVLSDLALEPTAADLPKHFRARAHGARRMREAAVAGAVWAGLGVVLTLMLGAAALFRVDMVRLWPRTAAAYAAVGLPVNPIGLVIEQVRAEPTLQDGHAALSVSGVIRNVEDHPITAPPLRITLLNAEGRSVGGKVAIPTDGRIPPGASRHFTVAVLDPPSSTANLLLAFDRNAQGAQLAHAPAPAGGDHPGAIALRGPAAPAEAQVLPPVDDAAPLVGGPPEPADAPAEAGAAAPAPAAADPPLRVIRRAAVPPPAAAASPPPLSAMPPNRVAHPPAPSAPAPATQTPATQTPHTQTSPAQTPPAAAAVQTPAPPAATGAHDG